MSDDDTPCAKAILDSISCLLADIDEYVESLEARFSDNVLVKVKDSVDDLLSLVDLLFDLDDVPPSSLLDDEALADDDQTQNDEC